MESPNTSATPAKTQWLKQRNSGSPRKSYNGGCSRNLKWVSRQNLYIRLYITSCSFHFWGMEPLKKTVSNSPYLNKIKVSLIISSFECHFNFQLTSPHQSGSQSKAKFMEDTLLKLKQKYCGSGSALSAAKYFRKGYNNIFSFRNFLPIILLYLIKVLGVGYKYSY